ncbi:MAG: histidinol dehydrogenase, partial [Limnochordia bacterium]
MRRVNSWELSPAELNQLLQRPAPEEVTIDARSQERSRAIFGEPLTPAQAVERILGDVRTMGDRAVAHYARVIDGLEMEPEDFFVSPQEWEEAQLEPKLQEALELAYARIKDFHSRQLPNSWFVGGEGGTILGQRYVPLDRVGIYVPGGSAPLFSTVLMTAVPAQVAGVKEVIMATPVGKDRKIHPALLVAARLAGVQRILKIGGAQAVAALAYGTETIPPVDKIVGPGNIFVTLAKKAVFGRVGIDMLAGPSEILVLADSSANPRHVAADLLSQAEHDPQAAAILITPSPGLAQEVEEELAVQLAQLHRRETAQASLERWGLIIICRDLEEGIELANEIAPEHLE